MSKIDFINDFNKVCEELNLDINPHFEFGLKVSNDSFNTDRVNIGIKNQDITQDNLIYFVDKLFDNIEDTNKFANSIYKDHSDKIQQIFLGYSNGATELYFECYSPGESSYCISFNSTDNKQNEYYPLDNSEEIINELIELIKEKTSLIIPESDNIFKGGFVKEGNIYYILIIEPMVRLENILKLLCYDTNSNNKENIDEWFNENKEKIISNIAYTIKNNQLILNIYVNESTRTN